MKDKRSKTSRSAPSFYQWHSYFINLIDSQILVKSVLFICFASLIAIIPQSEVYGQEKKKREYILLHPQRFYRKYFPNMKIKKDRPDSTFIKAYPNYLSIGAHVFSPAIGVDLKKSASESDGYDPSSKFRTSISDIIGFSLNYRYVGFGFAFLLKSGMNSHQDYSPSRYKTATIKFANGPTSLQFKYIRIRGFTDINQYNGVKPNPMFTQREDIVSKEYQFEGLRNFRWRKYSYIAPTTFAQRQVKSSAGFLLKGGFYYHQLSGDSSLLSVKQQEFFNDMDGVTSLRSLSIRVAPGVGGTFVFLRRVYLSASAFVSYDLYFYKYLTGPDEKVKGKHAFIFLFDNKISLGYHAERFYAGVRFETEQRSGPLQNLNLQTAYSYTGIELGYRFDAPKFVKKIYKKTMPPGM